MKFKRNVTIIISIYSILLAPGCKTTNNHSNSATKSISDTYQESDWFAKIQNKHPQTADKFNQLVDDIRKTGKKSHTIYYEVDKAGKVVSQYDSPGEVKDPNNLMFFKISENAPVAFRSELKQLPSGKGARISLYKYSPDFKNKIKGINLDFDFSKDQAAFSKQSVKMGNKYKSFVAEQYSHQSKSNSSLHDRYKDSSWHYTGNMPLDVALHLPGFLMVVAMSLLSAVLAGLGAGGVMMAIGASVIPHFPQSAGAIAAEKVLVPVFIIGAVIAFAVVGYWAFTSTYNNLNGKGDDRKKKKTAEDVSTKKGEKLQIDSRFQRERNNRIDNELRNVKRLL